MNDPFDEGVDAYGRGLPRDKCPYPEGDDRRGIWQDGWDEAKEAAENDDEADPQLAA